MAGARSVVAGVLFSGVAASSAGGQYSWQAELARADGTVVCSGAFVSEEYLVTAASCVYGWPAWQQGQVRGWPGGSEALWVGTFLGSDVTVPQEFVHELYGSDIAVVHVQGMDFGRIAAGPAPTSPILMLSQPAAQGGNPPAGSGHVWVPPVEGGWLVGVVVGEDECRRGLRGHLPSNVFCVNGLPKRADSISCGGAHGRPMVRMENGIAVQHGVISYCSGTFGVATRVSDWSAWIAGVVSGEADSPQPESSGSSGVSVRSTSFTTAVCGNASDTHVQQMVGTDVVMQALADQIQVEEGAMLLESVSVAPPQESATSAQSCLTITAAVISPSGDETDRVVSEVNKMSAQVGAEGQRGWLDFLKKAKVFLKKFVKQAVMVLAPMAFEFVMSWASRSAGDVTVDVAYRSSAWGSCVVPPMEGRQQQQWRRVECTDASTGHKVEEPFCHGLQQDKPVAERPCVVSDADVQATGGEGNHDGDADNNVEGKQNGDAGDGTRNMASAGFRPGDRTAAIAVLLAGGLLGCLV